MTPENYLRLDEALLEVAAQNIKQLLIELQRTGVSVDHFCITARGLAAGRELEYSRRISLVELKQQIPQRICSNAS